MRSLRKLTYMKVGLLQTNPQDDYSKNIDDLLGQIHQSSADGVETIILPEMFSYMGPIQGRIKNSHKIDEGLFKQLRATAAENKINIIAGSHAEKGPTKDRVFNTSVAYSAQGEILDTYRKVHLFNLKDSEGNPLYCESEVFDSGFELTRFSLECAGEAWKCLTAICYDLRFPEVFRNFKSAEQAPDVIFLPAAFTYQTGVDHWEVLLRARAIENQCYVVACNQTGFYSNGQKRNYGNSMIVDPWGKVIARMGEEVGKLESTLSKGEIEAARSRIPALANRVFY